MAGPTIAHITDAHLSPGGRRTAVLKDLSVAIFEDLIQQVRDRADLVLFGGDTIDNGSNAKAELDLFMDLVKPLDRWACVLGNHETRIPVGGCGRIGQDVFLAAVAGHGIGPGQTSFSEVVGDVRVIGINTTLAGSGGGHITDRTMRFLADELRHATEEHIVVLGHHLLTRPWAPFRLDVWDHEYLIDNRDAVNALLASHPRVRAYLCGHHHASRIDRVAGRGASGGFYHVVTPSASAYPCGARLLTFEGDRVVVESIRPRIDGIDEAALEAVMGGRKARRFSTLGSTGSFADYVGGRPSDNDVILPCDMDSTLRLNVGPLTARRRAGVR